MDTRNPNKPPLLSSHDSSDNIKSYHSMLFHKAYDDKKAPESQESGFSSRPDTPRPKTKRTTSTGAFIIEDNDTLGTSAFERSNNQYSSSPSHAISDQFLHIGNKS